MTSFDIYTVKESDSRKQNCRSILVLSGMKKLSNIYLRTCLHKLKSAQQGLEIGNNTNIFLVKRPNFIVL